MITPTVIIRHAGLANFKPLRKDALGKDPGAAGGGNLGGTHAAPADALHRG